MNGLIRSTIAGSVLLMAMSLAVTAQNPQNSQSAKGAGDESRRILSLENAWNQAEANHQ